MKGKSLKRAIANAGGCAAVALCLGLTKQAVSKWTQVPPGHVLKFADITGHEPYEIRPDLYPKPKARR